MTGFRTGDKNRLEVLEIRTESVGVIDKIDVTGKNAKDISQIMKRWGSKTRKIGAGANKLEETKFTVTIGKYEYNQAGELVEK